MNKMEPIAGLPSKLHSNDAKIPKKKERKETDFSWSKMKISENFNRQYAVLEFLVFRGYSRKSQGE